MMSPDDLQFLTNIAQGCAELMRISEIQYEYNQRQLVFQHDKVKLYHYHPKTQNPHSTPLLIVFATVNRPEVLDLFPNQSVIGGLLESGMDVYLLDWGYPDKRDKDLSLSDYACTYLHDCVNFIIASTQQAKINLLGICQGGLLTSCYATLYPTVKNLILISAPIDFQTKENTLTKIFRQFDVATFLSLMGNVPGSWLTQFFIALRPFELVGNKFLHFVDTIADRPKTQKFLRVEKWLHDAPDQTAASFKELIQDYYQSNKLIKGEIFFRGKRVDLANLTMPILNVMASEDEIIPVSASKALKKHMKSNDYTQLIYPSGHIGIYISEKVGKRMPVEIAQWLRSR